MPTIQNCVAIGAALALGTCQARPRLTHIENRRCIHKPYFAPPPLGRPGRRAGSPPAKGPQ